MTLNPTLSDAIEAYGTDRRAKGYAAGTRKNDARVLRALLASTGNIQTRSLRPQHLDRFWMAQTGWGPGTMNKARASLTTFIKWCQNRGYIRPDTDLLHGTRSQRVPPRNRVIIPQGEFETFLSGIEDPRHRAAVAIGLYLFTRISDTCMLRWQDYNEQTGTMDVYRPKTNTLDTLPVCAELQRELRRWRLHYASIVGHDPLPGWFIIPGCEPRRQYGVKGTKGFSISPPVEYVPTRAASLGGVMTDVLTKHGYYRPYEGGHTLRRSGAIALYNRLSGIGHDRAIRICQAMLGHSSLANTEKYLLLTVDQKMRNDLLAGKQMFPEQEATVTELEGRRHG